MKHQESRFQVSPADKSQEGGVIFSADMGKMAQESLEGQERAGKWAVMVIVAIGIFMITWTQLKVGSPLFLF